MSTFPHLTRTDADGRVQSIVISRRRTVLQGSLHTTQALVSKTSWCQTYAAAVQSQHEGRGPGMGQLARKGADEGVVQTHGLVPKIQTLSADCVEPGIAPVFASLVCRQGLVLRIRIINARTGEHHSATSPPTAGLFLDYDGAQAGRAIATASPGDDTFYMPPDAHEWELSFFFPHLSRRGRVDTIWRIRIEPNDPELREKYPNLSWDTTNFRCVVKAPQCGPPG